MLQQTKLLETYTVEAPNGDVIERGLSLEDAAVAILTYDGRDYQVRPDPVDDQARILMVTQFSHNRSGGCGEYLPAWLGERVIRSAADLDEAGNLTNREDALTQIWRQVVMTDWPGHPTAMTDADYDSMLALLDDRKG